MLNFIGMGSAFNTSLGNTSAYIRNKDTLFLIDCGGVVFKQIFELKLLEGVEYLNIVITHTHSDHVGSLADLIFYSYYKMKKIPKVYFPDVELMKTFLKCVGIETNIVEIIGSMDVNINMSDDKELKLSYIHVTHVENLPSYGMIIEFNSSRIYYSGDANEIPITVLKQLKDGMFDYFYQDTCGLDYEKNVHLSFDKLSKLIPRNLRGKVFCIHHDKALDLSIIKKQGFKVP